MEYTANKWNRWTDREDEILKRIYFSHLNYATNRADGMWSVEASEKLGRSRSSCVTRMSNMKTGELQYFDYYKKFYSKSDPQPDYNTEISNILPIYANNSDNRITKDEKDINTHSCNCGKRLDEIESKLNNILEVIVSLHDMWS